MIKILVLQLSVLILLFSSVAQAKRFSNQYTEFELPPGWSCVLEGAEWVCQSENEARKKEAIIILAAKVRGAQDSLDAYEAYLKKPKTYTVPGGKTQVSEARYTKKSDVNSHQWIDSLHMASEVPGFYTRYLATVKEDLGVAVTFSVAKDLYASYQDVFDKAVASLRVFRQKAGGSDYKLADNKGSLSDTTFIPNSDTIDISTKVKKDRPKDKKGGGDNTTLFLILGGAAVVGFLALGKKKKKKK